MTDRTQPEALRLALSIDLMDTFTNYQQEELDKAAAELRRLHAENTALQQGYDAARLEIDSLQSRVQELGAMLRTNCNRRIVELEAQLESIGAGGVEPLRRRECLHQIVEPAPAGEYPALPARTVDELGDYQRQAAIAAYRAAHGHEPDFGFAPDRAWIEGAAYVDADRAMRAQAAPAAVAPLGEYPHEQMDAMALARYKVVPSDASMFWRHMVVAGDGTRQLYVGREVECQNMARKFAGAFLDGAFAFHSIASAPATQAAPAAQGDAEDAARLDWLESQSQVNIERVRYLVADTSIYEVTPFNSTDYNGETLRKAIDAARKQGEHHD